MIAGLAATIALTALMMMKSAMGVMPDLDVIKMLAAMMGGSTALAWIAHFMIGTVFWGGLYAIVSPTRPGSACLGFRPPRR